MVEMRRMGRAFHERGEIADGAATAAIRPAATAMCLVLLATTAAPAWGQEVRCPSPATIDGDSTPASGSTARARLRHADPLVREMARGDVLYDEGRRDEAEAIYARLARAPADKRQSARRAKLKLAQAALRRADFATAERYVAEASGAGALPEVRTRAERVREQIAERRTILQAEAALDAIDPLVAERRFDEAVAATQLLLQQPCPQPADWPARVKIRLAQVHRARGDFPSANLAAQDALASATTPRVRERAAGVLTEMQGAARVAALRTTVDQANALIEAGNAAGAIGQLQPLLASEPPLPGDIDLSVRLRLARAYAQLDQFDAATKVLEPTLTSGAELDPEQYDAIARIYLARAGNLQATGANGEAALAYRELLAWQRPASAEVQGSARLGLARALSRSGDRKGALEQIALARGGGASPGLIERADRLLADLQDDMPFDRLVGYVQTGLAYDSNAPTLVSAIRDEDDDVPFPNDRKFDDWHARIDARLQYRTALNPGGSDYLDIVASGSRTLQFDLPELDRTRLGLRAGPVLALGEQTSLRLGGQFDIDWRDDRFRSSEPGAYIGITHDLTDAMSLATVYTLAWHNDYQDQRDGIHHELETQLRSELGDADVLTVNARAKREEAKLDRLENWRLLGGAGYRHRWLSEGNIVPFVEIGGEAERVLYDGQELNGTKRRDWKVNLEAAGGADIGRNWRLRLHYNFFDIDSNQAARERIANHQGGLTLRYSWK